MRDGLITAANQTLRTALCVIHETTLVGVPRKVVTNPICYQIRLPRHRYQFPSHSTCIHSFHRIVLVLPPGQSRLGMMLKTRCNCSYILFLLHLSVWKVATGKCRVSMVIVVIVFHVTERGNRPVFIIRVFKYSAQIDGYIVNHNVYVTAKQRVARGLHFQTQD
jgi:hypothetical protein